MRAGVTAVLAAAILGLGAAGIRAQTTAPGLDERVVVTGSAAPISAGSAGRALTVVTADDLARLPVASVIDALRLLPGVWVRQRGPFGSQSDIAIRGASFGQALILVDGVRLNDPQTGHHNGDLPVALEDIERIELLAGAGSSLHGADAVGGVINIITRRNAASPSARVVGGQDGLFQAGAAWRPASGPLAAISASLDRADDFAPSRAFLHQQVRAEFRLGRTRVALAHLDKDFGAAGYYGPAPSHETTTQTLLSAHDVRPLRSGWSVTSDAWFRSHGDEFLYDTRVAGAVPNRHRTQVVGGGARLTGAVAPTVRLAIGAEGTGEWLRSASLGDRDAARASVFTEVEARTGRLTWYPSLRLDAYSTFGHAWSPSLAVAAQVQPRLKWRGSVGRAFRVPTFTERFYVDPNHRASDVLAPERGWTADTGVDAYLGRTWVGSASIFVRRERDVIDWVREVETERWRTENIHRLRSHGFEASLRGTRGPVSLGVQYAFTRVTADRAAILSKYVDDYAPHGLGLDVGLRGPWSLQPGVRVEHRRPYGRDAWTTVDLRVSRPWRRVTPFIEVANLGDVQYEEIRGVAMPGRWGRAGVTVR